MTNIGTSTWPEVDTEACIDCARRARMVNALKIPMQPGPFGKAADDMERSRAEHTEAMGGSRGLIYGTGAGRIKRLLPR